MVAVVLLVVVLVVVLVVLVLSIVLVLSLVLVLSIALVLSIIVIYCYCFFTLHHMYSILFSEPTTRPSSFAVLHRDSFPLNAVQHKLP